MPALARPTGPVITPPKVEATVSQLVVSVAMPAVVLLVIVPPAPESMPTLGLKPAKSSVPPLVVRPPVAAPRARLLPSFSVPAVRVVPPA